MKAASVHGGGATLVKTSCSVGRRGQYAFPGMERLKGLDGRNSPEDMNPSSSASHPENTEEQEGDESLDDVEIYSDGGFSFFDLLIVVLRSLIKSATPIVSLQTNRLSTLDANVENRGRDQGCLL